MATNSNITVPQKYTAKYKNVGYGWDTSHPTAISKKFIILIYHYLHAVHPASYWMYLPMPSSVVMQILPGLNFWHHLLKIAARRWSCGKVCSMQPIRTLVSSVRGWIQKWATGSKKFRDLHRKSGPQAQKWPKRSQGNTGWLKCYITLFLCLFTVKS